MTKKEHLEDLAFASQIPILYEAYRYGAAADTLRRVMYLMPWPPLADGDGEVSPEDEVYWVGLHELGHLRDERRSFQMRVLEGDDLPRVEEEARAWAWALENSAYPLSRDGEAQIAWGMTDYMWAGTGNKFGYDDEPWEPSEAFRTIYNAIGPDPYWFTNVTTPEHYAKLRGWARPMWKELADTYDPKRRWSPPSESWRNDANEYTLHLEAVAREVIFE